MSKKKRRENKLKKIQAIKQVSRKSGPQLRGWGGWGAKALPGNNLTPPEVF